nr:MAG TPA: hypothetical protein [Caudoviricetes sp.]
MYKNRRKQTEQKRNLCNIGSCNNCPNFIYLWCGFLRKTRQTWRNTQFPTAYACKCS